MLWFSPALCSDHQIYGRGAAVWEQPLQTAAQQSWALHDGAVHCMIELCTVRLSCAMYDGDAHCVRELCTVRWSCALHDGAVHSTGVLCTA